jgi:hypothetical protein
MILIIIDLLKCKPKDYRYYLPAHYKLGCLGNINIRQLGRKQSRHYSQVCLPQAFPALSNVCR